MAYRHGERRQGVLFPASIEDYVPAEAPVRVYDAIIDASDLEDLGFEVDPHNRTKPEEKNNNRETDSRLIYGDQF